MELKKVVFVEKLDGKVARNYKNIWNKYYYNYDPCNL